MVRVTRRRSGHFGLASSVAAALTVALGGCSSESNETSEEPAIITHPRTSAGSQGRWTACVHDDSGPVPDDIQQAIDAAPSLADCPREEPLPCGACNDEGKLCRAGVTRGCCGRPYVNNAMMSPFDGWVCRCEGGSYNCWLNSRAASICDACTALPPGACSESTGACTDGCFSVNAAHFDPEQECVSTISERVGCTSIDATTSDTGCVRRVSDGRLFVATSFTRHLQSDDWEACSAEEIAKTQVVCD